MSTNKNAYEIRADILKEATGLVTHKYEKDMYIWESTRTRDEKLACANELYSFVDSK